MAEGQACQARVQRKTTTRPWHPTAATAKVPARLLTVECLAPNASEPLRSARSGQDRRADRADLLGQRHSPPARHYSRLSIARALPCRNEACNPTIAEPRNRETTRDGVGISSPTHCSALCLSSTFTLPLPVP